MIRKGVCLFIAMILLGQLIPMYVIVASGKGFPADGYHIHTWEQTDPPFVSAFSSGPCNELGNPGTGRVCKECGIAQEFLQSGDWVYTLLEDGTAEIVRCDVSETEANLITIPETVDGIPVTSVGDYAFRDGYYIGEIAIPEGVTAIGDFAFDSCSNLKKVTIPSSVNLIGRNPFLGTKTEVFLSPDNSCFEIVDDFLLEKQNKKLISCLTSESNPVRSVPMGTEVIGDYAFSRNYELSRAIIPDSVTEIGNYAFAFCYKTIDICIPDSVISIGDFAFKNCSKLTSIVIPQHVSSIGANPFMEAPVEVQVSPSQPYFSLQDGVLFERASGRLISYPYNQEMAEYSIPQGTREIGAYLSYEIDGKQCAESDFLSIIDDCSFLTYDPSPREPYMTYSLSFIPIDELIELLGGDTSSPSTKENTQEKRLSQIKRIESNGDESIITFQYDSNGRLISSTGSDDNVYTYSYDDAGRLIEVNCSYWEPYGPMYEYHYDENGFLVEVSGIGEGGGIAYTLENDMQGRVIRKTRSYDFGTAVTEYVYSGNGAHVEEVTTDTHSVGTVYQGKSSPQETTVKTASVDYTFDDQGRVLSETRTINGTTVRTTYDYSYPPLVFVCDENGMPYRCEIRDCAGIQIWYMVIGKGSHSIERDDDGYLSGMICDDADYQFRFSCEENPDWSLARDLFDDVETEDRYHDNTTKDTSEVQYVVGYVVNAESGLNVRQNPSTSSERVRRIHNGTRILISEQVTIDGMLWGRISDGWVCMNYIKLEEEESIRGVRYVVSPSAGVVNIRCEAGTSYESIERIVSGEEVIIYSQKIVDGREWGKTDAGWICMEYLTRSS